MRRTTGWALSFFLSVGCGGASASSSGAATAAEPRPSAGPITAGSSGGTSTTPRTMTREEFEAQWATSSGSTGRTDFTGMAISGAPPAGGPYGAYGGLGYDAEHPIAVCGTGESYVLVASHVCPDGSMPLGGDASAGAGARVGNVGANSIGHIIDLYQVPCATPVELYVDMYGCPGGGMPF